MERPDYMFLPLDLIPSEFSKANKLKEISKNGKVYINITKVIYGLPQDGLLANKQLQRSLFKEGYFPCKDSIGIWKHQYRPI